MPDLQDILNNNTALQGANPKASLSLKELFV
jgi:hypothetical protein